MKKTELLAPAGNMETLIKAIDAGADAIYVGGSNFSARAYAENFDKTQLKKAVEYCHIYDVKLYVTVNTVIFENEIEDCLNYLKYLYEINVDAVIMQDIGMISLSKKYLPNLEIHASTQINCHSDECLKFLKDLKVKRVVLARELDINTIKKFKTKIDLEIFIHGALCVSYSGRCLLSSLNGGRSGNRGKCTGPCRLPYTLNKNGKKLDIDYPLSTKDLCTVNNIKEILDLNISSLKIEGRMKSKEYVSYVTKVYRRLIDQYYNNEEPKIKKEEMINLYKLYNRKFTNGYLFNDNIYNTSSSNHIGYPLGEIIKITPKKIYIKLTDKLYMDDGIRFISENKGMIAGKIYNEKGLLVNHIDENKIAIIENKINLKKKGKVSKTIDRCLVKDINQMPKKKIEISFKLKGYVDKPLELTITDGKNTITKLGIILSKAIKRKTTQEEIIEKLKKLGNTPFKLKNVDIDIKDVFIPLKFLNELRHKLIDLLIKEKTKTNEKVDITYKKKMTNYTSNNTNIFVENEKQLLKYKSKAHIIYTDDYNLYKKYKDKNTYYKLPDIMESYPNYKNENLLISDLGSLNKYHKENKIITDYSLNITNSESVKLLQKYNTKLITLSPELPDYEILKYTKKVEIIVKGKLDLMIIKNFHTKAKQLTITAKDGNNYKLIRKKDYFVLKQSKQVDIKENIKIDKRIILSTQS